MRLAEGKRDDAAAALQRSLDLFATSDGSPDSFSGQVWHELGRLHAAGGKLAGAETALRQALELAPGRRSA